MSFERTTSKWLNSRWWNSSIRTNSHLCHLPYVTSARLLASDDDTYKLLHYLDLAQNPRVGQEAAVDNFAARLLEMLVYASGRRVIVTRRVLPLIICGTQCSAQTDACICDENDYLLLVQQNENTEDLEPQLIVAY